MPEKLFKRIFVNEAQHEEFRSLKARLGAKNDQVAFQYVWDVYSKTMQALKHSVQKPEANDGKQG